MNRLRVILLVSGGVLSVAAAFAAGRSFRSAAEAVDAPVLRIERTHWDLGEAKPGAVLQTRMVIANAGSRRLVINEDVCALCEADVLPTTIVAPGDTARVELPWDTSGITGPLEMTRRFTTNDPQRPTFQVQVSADIVPTSADDDPQPPGT